MLELIASGLDNPSIARRLFLSEKTVRNRVSAILTKALGQGMQDPAKLGGVIEALGDSLVYVGGRTPFEYAYALRNLDPAKITTCVVQGRVGFVGAASVVFPDVAQARRLGRDARRDASLRGC